MLGISKKQPTAEPEVEKQPTDEELERLVEKAYWEGLRLKEKSGAFGIDRDRGDDGWCFTREPVLYHDQFSNVRVSPYFRTRTAALQELPRFLELGGAIVFGDVDASRVKVACAIHVGLAQDGHSTLYATINGILNTRRLSDLTAPDFLLIDWKGPDVWLEDGNTSEFIGCRAW